jgi:aryl-alcohol dehydrogenase-like predicted oxidoreductase
VSVFALGTGPFGTAIGEHDARDLLDTFAANGGRFLDTADVYGDWASSEPGAAERIIGAWLRGQHRATEPVVGTKCGMVFEERRFVRVDLSRRWIERCVEQSLSRLGLGRIDLLWFHRDQPEMPIANILETVARLVDRKLVRYAGCSNWSTPRMADAFAVSRERGLPRLVASQVEWSLAARRPESLGLGERTLDRTGWTFHAEEHLPLVAYSPQARGFFAAPVAPRLTRARKLADRILARLRIDQEGRGRRDKFRTLEACYATAANRERHARASALARQHGVTPTRVALAWLLAQPFQVVPILGCRTQAQLLDALKATEIKLAPAELESLAAPW